MNILALVKNGSNKQVLKDFFTNMNYGIQWVQSVTTLQSALDSMPDVLILEAEVDDLDYEDILADLNLRKFQGKLRILLINNTSDHLSNPPHIEAVIEEFTMAQSLTKIFTKSDLTAKRILYASDDKFMHRVIGDILKKNGFEVITALDGNEALGQYKSKNPCLILTDLDMPGLNGLELCRTIKIDLLDLTTPVVILSGSSFEEDIAAAHECHAKAYLIKPVPPEKLINKINSLIKQ
jgi:DNA-binding response OmpR family regulator